MGLEKTVDAPKSALTFFGAIVLLTIFEALGLEDWSGGNLR